MRTSVRHDLEDRRTYPGAVVVYCRLWSTVTRAVDRSSSVNIARIQAPRMSTRTFKTAVPSL